MVPVSLVVRSRVIQGMRAGVASWTWSSVPSGTSVSWPTHQPGQLGGIVCLSLSSASGCIGLPFLGLWCVVGLSGGE